MKNDDIFKIYNDTEQMLSSIDLEKKDTTSIDLSKIFTKLNEKENNINDVKLEQIKNDNQILLFDEDKKQKENITNNNKSNYKEKKKNKSKKCVITLTILDILAIICLFLMYGPISYFRNLWVTSAMTTMSHKYLAYVFFTPSKVTEIMSNNKVIEVEEDTNIDEIEIKEEIEEPEEIIYSSLYEEQVLKRDEGNDLYKVIKLEGDGYKGHMLVVYDPSKIKLGRITNPKYGKTLDQFTKEYNAVAGVNAGGFTYSEKNGYSAVGVLIQDGKIISNKGTTGWGGGIVGFTNNNILVLTKASAQEAINMGVRDAVSFGPFLIVNGIVSEFKGNGGYGLAPRTAIGQRKDGIVLIIVIDGRRVGHSIGIDMKQLTDIFVNYGAYNASNLDGGGSSTLVVEGQTLSVAGGYGYTGDRYLPNAWLVIDDKEG